PACFTLFPYTTLFRSPVLLVVCRDAQHHAPAVEKFLESKSCMNGAYRGKVLRVDSTLPEDDWMDGLLNVEDTGNPYEIVVNVGRSEEHTSELQSLAYL